MGLEVNISEYFKILSRYSLKARFRKGRGTRDQIANICWIIKKAIESQKNIYFCFIDYAKAFDCVDHNKLWKILNEIGIRHHLTCLLRNLYAGQEATVNWTWNNGLVQNSERSMQGCILSPCLLLLLLSRFSCVRLCATP